MWVLEIQHFFINEIHLRVFNFKNLKIFVHMKKTTQLNWKLYKSINRNTCLCFRFKKKTNFKIIKYMASSNYYLMHSSEALCLEAGKNEIKT